MTTQNQTEPLQLTVSNFGPIAKAEEIDLRPLTVFVGPSNTGKSYLATLIYALHGFFSIYTDPRRFRSINPILRKGTKDQHPLDDDDNLMRLLDWITDDVLEPVETKSSSAASPIPLPDFIVSMVRSLLNDLSDFSAVIAKEVGRSFGIEDTIRLIRHGNREGAKITLRCKLFEYQLALKRSKPEEGGISISEEIPLYIHPRRIIDVIKTPPSGSGNREKRDGEYLIREIFSLLLSDVVKPLNNSAYYLPAARTGVMHTHRSVVASLIERAPYAGIRHATPLPSLSGVLADFLENLVRIDEPRRRPNNDGNLAANLEQEILKGEILHKNSETGYPMFSYQPHGWQGDLPLMNASSMVSELAPVVLYLRHIVQPGDVLIIEEPESHLHPKMQVEFIRQLAAVVHSGIRVMLTTHSEWVLDELANLVRLSELPKAQRKGLAGANVALSSDQLGVWLFEPKQRPKGSVVKEIPFDEDFGGFRSGFDDVAIGTYNDYAEISNRIEQSSEHGKSR